MIANVNFNLISGEDKGAVYAYGTIEPYLNGGDIVLIKDQGKVKLANFVGYNFKPNIILNEGVVVRSPKEQNKEYWSKVESRLLKEPLWITDYAYEFYKNNFFFNEDISFEDARKKLTRNVILSRGFGEGKPKVIGDLHVFFYGTMEIRVKGNTVVGIKKSDTKGKKFRKNKRKYHYLNEHFELVGK